MSDSTLHIGRRQAMALFGSSLLIGCGSDPTDAKKDEADPLNKLPLTGEKPTKLVIGITPSTGDQTHTKLEPLYFFLEKTLGVEVDGRTADSYDHLAKLVKTRQVDLGVFSPAAYVMARKELPAVAVATATRDGSPTYLGYIVAKVSYPRPRLEDLKGKHIAWVHNKSTSGYFYPRAMLKAKGIDPDTYFGKQTFAGNHAKALQQVLDGEVFCCAAASPFVNPETNNAVKDAPELLVIAKTKRIPLDCIVVQDSLTRDFAKRLRQALFDVHRDEEYGTSPKLDNSWGLDGFVKPMHDRYDDIERVINKQG
jgi:phosphate/phosphite/phosphonate ABC transporter binding protein